MNPNAQRADSLSPEQVQMFLAGLSGLAPEEVRKAKLLYLRNAVSEYRALRQGVSGFRVAQGCFAVIPFFWPILWAQNRMIGSQIGPGPRADQERHRRLAG